MLWLAALGCVAAAEPVAEPAPAEADAAEADAAADAVAKAVPWPPDVTQNNPADHGWDILSQAEMEEKISARVKELGLADGTRGQPVYEGPEKAPLTPAQQKQVVALVAQLMVTMRGTMLQELSGQVKLHGADAVAAKAHSNEVDKDTGLPPVTSEDELEFQARDQTIADSLRGAANTLNKTHEVRTNEAVEAAREEREREQRAAAVAAAQAGLALLELREEPEAEAEPATPSVTEDPRRPFAEAVKTEMAGMRRPPPPRPPIWGALEDVAWAKEVKADVLAAGTKDWTALFGAATDPDQQRGRYVERERLRIANAAHRMAAEKLADPAKFVEKERMEAYHAEVKQADAAFAAAKRRHAAASAWRTGAASGEAPAAPEAHAPPPPATPETPAQADGAAEETGVTGTLLEFAANLRSAADAAWQRL